MNLRTDSHRSHPPLAMIALYTRGELPVISRSRVRRHMLSCADCQHEARLFSEATIELRREAVTETLTAFEAIADWSVLEREMFGNIVVGLAAARCIENVGRKRVWLPRIAVAGGLCALFAGGWMAHIPREQTTRLAASLSRSIGFHPAPRPSNIVQATPTGIAVRSDGVTLTILHPSSAVVSVSGSSSVEARFIDEDTGQLTITNVYGQ